MAESARDTFSTTRAVSTGAPVTANVTDPATTGDQVRILLVDDHVLVRAALRMLIETRGEYRVVAEAGRADEAVMLAVQLQPTLVVLDLDLDLGSGPAFDVLDALRSVTDSTRVLILTGLRDPALHRQAVRLGARGVVSKEKAAESLLTAIEKVGKGELWLDRTQSSELIAEMSRAEEKGQRTRSKIDCLTSREREIVALVARGLKNKEIAERLFITDTTVRHHLTSIFAKLEVADRLSLLLFAVKNRVVSLTH